MSFEISDRDVDAVDRGGRRPLRWQIGSLLAAALLGAIAVFLFDPVQGRRRRVLLRDKMIHRWHDLQWYGRKWMHHLRNLFFGLPYRARYALSREAAAPDDAVLVARVRSAMGRVLRHSGSIEVSAHNGEVTLRGPILAMEVRSLMRRVRGVRGVRAVVDHLDVHTVADHVPGLQGEGPLYLR